MRKFFTFFLALAASVGMSWALTPLSGDYWDDATGTLTVNSNTGDNAYDSETEIKHVIVSDEVTELGWGTFFFDSLMTTVELGKNLERIGISAFNECRSLSTITVPASVTYIGVRAFRYCTSLTTFICEAVTPPTIGNAIFENANNLTAIYVPAASVEAYKTASRWSDYASLIVAIPTPEPYTFYFHPGSWAGTYGKYAVLSWSTDYEAAVYGEFMTPVAGHEGWFSTSVPDGNSNLYIAAYNADATDPAVGVMNWSEQLSDAGTYTYYYNNVGYMEDFDGRLTDGRILSGNILYTVDEDNLTAEVAYDQGPVAPTGELIIPSTITCKKTYTVTSIYAQAYWYGSGITSVSLPNTLLHIGDAAFIGTGLTSVTIPSSVKSIDDGAFALCGNLSSVTLEEGLTALGTQMFQGCNSLTQITFPNSITDLSAGILSNCENLVSVTLGTGVDTIENNAFGNSDKLARLTIYAPAPPKVKLEENPALVETCSLMVPSSVKAAYQAHPYWSKFEIKGIYIVTFKDKDGNTIKAEAVEEGQSATAPDAPEVGCYTFTGWSADFSDVHSDLEVNALYTRNVYTVTFLNEGVQHNQQHVFCGDDAAAPADPTKEGHHFTGWDAEFTNVQSDLTIHATFEINTYTVTFKDSEGNTIGEPQVVNWNTAAEAPKAPEVECNHFIGWDKAFTNVKEDLVVNALYSLNTYTVIFNDNDGSELKKQTVACGDDAVAPEAPHHTGYTFIGWDKAFTNVKEDLVVTATFERGEDAAITVEFYDFDNDKIASSNVVIRIPAADDIEGFYFVGWRPVAENILDNATIKIEAMYIPIEPTSAPDVYTNPANPAQKLVRDGNVYILKDGHEYTITGLKVK